jgi:hypothetical protein
MQNPTRLLLLDRKSWSGIGISSDVVRVRGLKPLASSLARKRSIS